MAHPYANKIPGSATAHKRYGSLGPANMKAPKDECCPQAPEDQQAPGYDNDTPSNWLRGMGPGEACGKPGFDYQKKGK